MPSDNVVVMGEKEQSLYMYIYNIYKQCRKSVEVEAADISFNSEQDNAYNYEPDAAYNSEPCCIKCPRLLNLSGQTTVLPNKRFKIIADKYNYFRFTYIFNILCQIYL